MFSHTSIFAAVFASLFPLGLGSPLQVRGVAYYDPTVNGGSMLDNAGDGLGEPLNVCSRAFSDIEPVLTKPRLSSQA